MSRARPPAARSECCSSAGSGDRAPGVFMHGWAHGPRAAGFSLTRRCQHATTTAPSTAISVAETTFSDAERFALAGFLAGQRGLTRDAYPRPAPVRHVVPEPQPSLVRGAPSRHRVLRPSPQVAGQGSGHGGPSPVHGGRLLPLRRAGRPPGPSAAVHVGRTRLDYESHANGTGSQRGRRSARGCGPCPTCRARPWCRSSPLPAFGSARRWAPTWMRSGSSVATAP